MFWLLLLSSLVILITYLYRLEKNYNEKYKELLKVFPSPNELSYLPVLGNFIKDRDPGILFAEVRRLNKGNQSWSLRFPIIGYYALHLTNAEDAELMLTNTMNIKKSVMYTFGEDWVGEGLLTSSGDKWHERRKMLTPAFHMGILRKFTETMIENSEKLVKKLEIECEKNETNIKPIISYCTLNIICETSMGTSLEDGSKNIKIDDQEYFSAVHKMGSLLMYRILRPWLYAEFIFKFFLGKKYDEYIKLLHKFTYTVISEREKTLDLDEPEKLVDIEDDFGGRKKFALLDLLLAEKKKNNIDLAGVREEVDTFMFEGHDTVASSMIHTLFTLAKHPEIQDKIVDELSKIFGREKRRTTYQDLQNMNYLEMCIKESLRLYPSVYAYERQTTKDVTIRGVTLPKNSIVMIHAFDIHRDPRYFPNPEVFDPERFSSENVIGRNPFAYVPFSAGPRNCIGQKFAMLELKSVLSAILWDYVLEPVENSGDLKFYLDLVLRTKGPLNIKFRRRIHQ